MDDVEDEVLSYCRMLMNTRLNRTASLLKARKRAAYGVSLYRIILPTSLEQKAC